MTARLETLVLYAVIAAGIARPYIEAAAGWLIIFGAGYLALWMLP